MSKLTQKSKKRIGRGYGSGVGGHTATRGTKGQHARSKVRPLFEGTKSNKDFFRKTPMLRGKGKLKSYKTDRVIIQSSQLSVFSEGDTVDAKTIVKKGLLTEKEVKSYGVKILFDQEIKKKLNIQLPASTKVLSLIHAVSAPKPKAAKAEKNN